MNIYEHQCSIQPVEPLAKRLVDDEDDGNDDENKPPTLTVIGDIQCLIEDDVEGKKVLIEDLIRYASQDDPENVSYAFSGDTCIKQFINKLTNLIEVVGKDKQRDIIEELYKQGIKVENQLTAGAKTLKF